MSRRCSVGETSADVTEAHRSRRGRGAPKFSMDCRVILQSAELVLARRQCQGKIEYRGRGCMGGAKSIQGANMPFSPELKSRMFVRSMRHCCLCRKQCGTNIEVAHILDEAAGGSNDEDNGIPVCFDCHQEVGAYRDSHPKGNKFRPDELRQRRDAVFELVHAGQIGTTPSRPPREQVNAAVLIQGPNAINISGERAVVLGANAIRIVGPVVHNETSSAASKVAETVALSDLEFSILVVVGQRDRVTAREVASAAQVSEQKATFYLDELAHKHRLVDWFGNMNRGADDHYSLTHAGRGVLVERDIF